MKRCIFLSLVLVLWLCPMAMAADPAPAPPNELFTSTNILISIVSALAYFFLKPKGPTPEIPASGLTGRPVLDLIVSMVMEHPKVAASPLLQAAVRAEAKALKSILDEYNVPVVPLPPSPKVS